MKPEHHKAPIVLIDKLFPHTNADTLELIHISGYQVVVKKGQFRVGDLAVYIYPDSVVPKTEPFRFIWEGHECEPDGFVPEKRRRITVRKFRKEWSEGLLLPISDFSELWVNKTYNETENCTTLIYSYKEALVEEGQDVSDILGIKHYEAPESGPNGTKGENTHAPHRRPKTVKGWFFYILWKLGFKGLQQYTETGVDIPVYDVEAMKNHMNCFQENELVYVTEKIHGSSARYLYLNGHMYAGSHYLWKAPKSNCIWRKALEQNSWIEEWCCNHEGYTLYGEVTPTQKNFNYGCGEGEAKFFAFDIRTPEGTWIKPFTGILSTGIRNCVPVLDVAKFNVMTKSWVDGPSQVANTNHMREGIVVTPINERIVPGLGRLQLKIVSNSFLEKDSK